MDVKFDYNVAKDIIDKMKKNCDHIVNDSRDLRKITDVNNKWQDKQSEAFKNNIEIIVKDINLALQQESEYLKAFWEKANELKENS